MLIQRGETKVGRRDADTERRNRESGEQRWRREHDTSTGALERKVCNRHLRASGGSKQLHFLFSRLLILEKA
ncbi:hypothetical protein LINPERPRIM_LOCUS29877 [Linum perenne]